MAIFDFFLSRNNAASTPSNYIGHTGRLFYDSTTGEIRISDGNTAGGLPIPITIATANTVGGVRPGAGFTISPSGVLSLNAGPMFELDGNNVFNLKVATESQFGGVKLGPGVTVNAEGQIIIDSAGLEFSFGDFASTVETYTDLTDYAVLQTINADEDMILASNGDGGIKVVGEFRVYKTNGTILGSLEDYAPIFRVKSDGQIQMLVPKADALAGALEIIGNSEGTLFSPNQTGVIVHVTGNQNLPCRNYFDANNNYAILVGRRYNGTVESPTGVLNGEIMLRIAAQGTASDGEFETFGPARISFYANEDQQHTAQGGRIGFEVTKNGFVADGTGTNTITAMSIDAQTGVTSAVGFVGNISGNAGTVTNGVYTTDTGTVTNNMLAGSIANAKLANSTISGTALGGTLAALSAGNYLTGTDYTGATARTFAVDATTAATASKVVARDANAGIAAATTTLATREAGSFGAGQTITINMATDNYVHATITSERVTVAYTNITPGRQIYLLVTNASGADQELDSGIAATRMTNAKAIENMKNGGTSRLGVISFGTTVAGLYGNFEK